MNDKWDDYTEYLEEIKQQNADLVAALVDTQKLLDDIYEEDIVLSQNLDAVYEKNKQALAKCKEGLDEAV